MRRAAARPRARPAAARRSRGRCSRRPRSAAAAASLGKASASSPPYSVTLALARSTSCSRVPARLRHADHREVELPAPRHAPAAREDLLVGEVAGGAEEDQRVRARPRRSLTSSPRGRRSRSAWRRAPGSGSRPRRGRRSARRATAVSTWAGTPSSLAAATVQRPSPESETLPPKLLEVGVCRRGPGAVRSSSQEATTLPRRHSSVMSARSKSYW